MNAIPATPFPQVDAKQQVPGPVPDTRMTPEFVELIGRLAYLWAWPMVNVHNRLVAFDKLPEPGLVGGIVPWKVPVPPTTHFSRLLSVSHLHLPQ